MSNSFYVYTYINPITLQPFYVGKGQGRRDKVHLREEKKWGGAMFVAGTNHTKLQVIRDLRVAGLEPLIVRSLENVTNERACEEERRLIQQLGRIDLGTGILTNLSDGGEGGMLNPSQEMRDHLSKVRIGNGNGMFGKTHSEETKASLSAQAKARNTTGESNPMFGKPRTDLSARNKLPKKWITKESIDKQILTTELNEYLAAGWVAGRSSQRRQKKPRVNCPTCGTQTPSPSHEFCSRACANKR